ncbi:multidrug effflux MFS transporter [[Acidovorax] ebreus]|uniref:Bcr/CflA family efflux transporter n=1 Tax=Acidovorax ebreus (strain TPSY) TaxID=535289 RepID=A0A9J9QCX7_ACIET|nr:multidrug effflux MFS transporter [[Acidovorax] ebreus]ACM33918.1 drug resistance transporter, Bcr/CflA subfamily [[Acidovorax] ebreus TPSY]
MRASPSPSAGAPPLWLLVLITLSGTLAMHMFVPALPDAARALGVGPAAVQATISIYIVGLALGQLIYGPLSDALGRRPLLLGGLALYAAGSIAAMLAPTAPALIAARFIQALGGCAGLALGRAMVRDTNGPVEAVRALALLNLMMMVGPGMAPLAGSGLVALGGWRAVFVALALAGVATLLLSWRKVPETGTPTGRVSPGRLARAYAALLRSPTFLAYAVGGGCATTAVYAFIAAAPFIITEQLGHPLRDVGIALGVVMVGMAIGNALTRRLALSMRLGRLLVWGNAVSVACALVFLALELLGYLTLEATVGLMLLFVLGAGMASPAALSKVLTVDARQVGAAAGLYGFAQMALGALFTLLVGWGSNPALASSCVLLGAALVGQGCLQFALRREKRVRGERARGE